MNKLIIILLSILSLNTYSQKLQIESGIMTDNKNTLSILINTKNNKVLMGIGIYGNASLIQTGITIKNRLQIITGFGMNETKNNTQNYLSLKTNLLLNKNFLIGIGIDNQNRGMYSIGYKF